MSFSTACDHALRIVILYEHINDDDDDDDDDDARLVTSSFAVAEEPRDINTNTNTMKDL